MFKPYQKGSHISEREKILSDYKLFCEDLYATITSRLTSTNKNIIYKIYLHIPKLIAEYCDENRIFAVGEIEVDESFFGAKRVKGNGANGKIKVFGMMKRGDKVYTQFTF